MGLHDANSGGLSLRQEIGSYLVMLAGGLAIASVLVWVALTL